MKEKRKIVISNDSMDKYFVLVCEKLENLERLTKGLEPRRRFIHTQVLHTKTQFLKFMQIVCGNLNNLHHIIEIQKERKEMMPGMKKKGMKKNGNGMLTAKQKTLPPALQKRIIASKKRKK